MKKNFIFLCCSILFLMISSCKNNHSEIETLQSRLDSVQHENEFMKSFVGTIGECIDSISNEHIAGFLVTTGETPMNERDLLANRLELLGKCMENQKEKISMLENELKSFNKDKAESLNRIIVSLKKQIAEKDSMIVNLQKQLDQKNIDIKALNVKVGNLTEEVSSLNELTEQQDNALKAQDEMLNEAFVKIASTKELQNAGLLSKGSLFKKKKFDLSATDKSKFERIDIRNKTTFSISAKKIKILTPVVDGSYYLTKNDDGYTLTISNPSKFWSVSNILVIQAD